MFILEWYRLALRIDARTRLQIRKKYNAIATQTKCMPSRARNGMRPGRIRWHTAETGM